jgi:hypothetical protein
MFRNKPKPSDSSSSSTSKKAPSKESSSTSDRDVPGEQQRAYDHFGFDADTTKITRSLKVGGVFGASDVQLLASVLRSNKLTVLRICGVALEEAMRATLFDAFSACPTLQRLYLTDLHLGDVGGKALWASLVGPQAPVHLTLIDVRSNEFGAEGLEGIEDALQAQSDLRSLDLSGNPIGDLGLARLVSAFLPRSQTFAGGGEDGAEHSGSGSVDPVVCAVLTELRLSTIALGEKGLHRLLAALADSRVGPSLAKVDVSNNAFPARPASYGTRSCLEHRRKDRLKRDPEAAGKPVSKVEPHQVDDDGMPKRFVPGLKLRPTNPLAAQRLREVELAVVLQGGFEISESEAAGVAPLKANAMLAGDALVPRSLYHRDPKALPSPRPNRPPEQYPLTADLSLPRTVRSAFDRKPTLETPSSRPFGLVRPLPPNVPAVPSQVGSASRPLGGNRPRRFRPLSLHDEKPVLRSEYTNLTKALVLPQFVHDFRTKGGVPSGL